MTTSVFCCRKLIVHIHVFRRSTMKVPAFSNFLISLKSLICPEKLDFIGESYKKYIELFNHCYEEHYKRDFSSVFFDCTNYYFEIDLPKEDNQKGPSKKTGMNRSLARPCFWMQTWFLLPYRCIPEMSQKNHT